MENIEEIVGNLVIWIQNKVKDAGANGVVFGLSGGIDSAVVAGISKIAFPETSLGLIMPCHSNPMDEEHALLIADRLNLDTKKVDLTNTFDTLLDATELNKEHKMAIANIKPRLRMTTLYYYGQSLNYLVLGGSNRSEFTVGYFTKHGDSGVDLLPLANFVKKEIWEIGRYLNLPDIIINKPPTAGLWENQTDEDEMGFSYEILDNFIETGKGPKESIDKIKRLHSISQHKREFPPVFLRNK
ncbi:NAD(+) synthase [Wansuia hejianensis]|uniref:NH(3)-dependent NAD(+) synthetase n=1 Tax=Wansuia hejianensis TaxID=2763667 RepID=A0A926F070_9FIRM|nr:NAD(+) synthase [Wansuia hejianensis]MBC8590732.1 NAD(+) synthase [Wansuia hejianensis]